MESQTATMDGEEKANFHTVHLAQFVKKLTLRGSKYEKMEHFVVYTYRRKTKRGQ